MNGIKIGLFCICYGIFLFFVSSREKKNMFGYKSLQQGMHKDVWRWTNQCFGLLLIVGAIFYLTFSIVLYSKGISFSKELNLYGKVYLLTSIVLTECYTMIRRHRSKSKIG